MADEKPPAAADAEASRVQSIADQLAELKDSIMSEVRGLIGTDSKAHQAAQSHEEKHLERPSDTAEGLESMVNSAIDKVLSGRDKAAADDAHRKQHEQIEAAAAERKPMERTRRHRFMGWGEPE